MGSIVHSHGFPYPSYADDTQLVLDKAKLLFLPGKPSPIHHLSRTNVGMALDDQLSLAANMDATSRSFRSMPHHQKDVCVLHLEGHTGFGPCCHLMAGLLHSLLAGLAGLPACTIQPLQIIQNAAPRLVFNRPRSKFFTTPLLRTMHWLLGTARIRLKSMRLARPGLK